MTLGDVKPRNSDERVTEIDEFLACSGATIREGFGEAYYRPGDDTISLPRFEAFKNVGHFYATAFDELDHYADIDITTPPAPSIASLAISPDGWARPPLRYEE